LNIILSFLGWWNFFGMFDAEFFFNQWLGLIMDSKLLKVETTANQVEFPSQ